MDVVAAVAANASTRKRDLGGRLDRVAGVAIEPFMGSIQDVAGLGVMVETPADPAVRVVAQRAIAGQAALVMLILVAARAGPRRLLEGGRAVAFLARHNGVAPDEREACDIVIEGHLPAPAGLFVALLAAGAQLRLMRVILLVAGDAGCCELVAIKVAGVTGIAFDLGVLSAQRELGHAVVIELHGLPLGRGVASLALGAVACRMSVLQAMAGDAGRWEILVAFSGMTGGAVDVLVGAFKGEFGLAVVERLDPAPAILAVAAITGFTQAQAVRILRFVAIEAAAGGAPERNRGCMATLAPSGLVHPLELEVGNRVVEGLAVQLHDVGGPALVITVAKFAVLAQCISLAAMKAPSIPSIGGSILMACEAQAGL